MNHVIDYLASIQKLLEESAAQIESLIEEYDDGETHLINDAREEGLNQVKQIVLLLAELRLDMQNMSNSKFKNKWL